MEQGSESPGDAIREPRVTRAKDFEDGSFETVKFAHRRHEYYAGLNEMLELGYKTTDFIHNFSAFVGHMSLWRVLTLYELYKKTLGIAGHVADVGIHMGASTLLFAKLVEIFEGESLTLVHGFDWFRGFVGGDGLLLDGKYAEDEVRFRALVRVQHLEHVLKVHKLDVVTEIDDFFEAHPSIRFKLIYVDVGTYDAVSSAIRAFWPRLTPGGILVSALYNNEVAPGESRAISDLLPDAKVQTIPNSWIPMAFIEKPYTH